MLKLMLQKLVHKKWMVLCLILGSILLTATVVSFPLYRQAAFDRMLEDEYGNYLAETGKWPAINRFTTISKKDREGKAIGIMEKTIGSLDSTLGVQEKETVLYYSLSKSDMESEMNRADLNKASLRLGFLSSLGEHVELLSGDLFSEAGVDETGAIEAVISEGCMTSNNLLVGETLVYTDLKGPEGEPLRVKVTGIFTPKDETDFYWQVDDDDLDIVLLMQEQLFREKFLGEAVGEYTISCNYFHLYEYEGLDSKHVDELLEKTIWLKEESNIKSTVAEPRYRTILEDYCRKRDRIEATLFILQVPVLILLCAFLFMISGQMYDMEKNEISVMKSRGGSSGQVFRLYLYQSIFLALVGALAGIPLGTVFCRILGSTQNFLEFNLRRTLEISFTTEVWLYAAGAIIGSILIMTVPALKHSRLTIVKLKQSNALKKKSLWEKLFLDVILIGISLYGYYSYSRSADQLVQNVLEGESLDPLLYLSSSLFIVGLGLLFLRLQPMVVRLVYMCGRNHWGPASYASFMENIKNGGKQHFIMLFMILTISLGMYHATVARTILQNACDNAEYLESVDFVLKERWAPNVLGLSSGNGEQVLPYVEPDFSKYASMPGVETYTKVYIEKYAKVMLSGRVGSTATVMGIHTKEFGETTYMRDGLLEKPYYELLNKLAVAPKGVLVSRNFQTIHGLKVGDSIEYRNGDNVAIYGTIVDFFDYWPGYEPVTISLQADQTMEKKDNLLIVANLSTVQQGFGVNPYEIWVNMKEDADSDALYQWIEDKNIHLSKFRDREVQLKNVLEDPLLQGTNGVLTMGFIVTIILCGVGYLIYWIMSIRSREMLFGVLRACGMHKGELFHILINEQIFSGVLSILAGIGIGGLTSKMFVPMLQSAYAAANQVLPMQLITNPLDMYRLYGVVFGVMALCLVVLIILVFKLNVTKALKLGEE